MSSYHLRSFISTTINVSSGHFSSSSTFSVDMGAFEGRFSKIIMIYNQPITGIKPCLYRQLAASWDRQKTDEIICNSHFVAASWFGYIRPLSSVLSFDASSIIVLMSWGLCFERSGIQTPRKTIAGGSRGFEAEKCWWRWPVGHVVLIYGRAPSCATVGDGKNKM